MHEFLPESKYFGGKLKVEFDISNYAINTDLEHAASTDTSKFAEKDDLGR